MATPQESAAPAEAAAPATGVARVHRLLCLLFLACGVVQFLFAGYSAFGGSTWDAHTDLGDVLLVFSLVILVVALVGRRAAVPASAVLFGLMIVQMILGTAGDDAPVLGALHPLNGMLILGTAMAASAGQPMRFGPPRRG